ncbi:MAG: maltodextrin glucosidase [Oscillibacter sp.]|nr:maltodextrin glucosidase [Oscillibacter sp.]
MWYDSAVFYQIYPIGLLGAPRENPEDNPRGGPVPFQGPGSPRAVPVSPPPQRNADAGKSAPPASGGAGTSGTADSTADGTGEIIPAVTHRLPKLADWLPHITKLGADAVYLCPLFESDSHGYDTRDYRSVDRRLGDNGDLEQFVRACHDAGVRVVLDGVFNHVGRNFWAFRDVRARKWDSPYKDWFHISFDGNSAYNDGFWYEGWEGHYNLVKLNLKNPAVVDYLLDTVKFWVERFGIDGLRLDVAYCLDKEFLRRLRVFTSNLNPAFFLVGETLHGDYNQWVRNDMLHSCTNYECYKGLYSSFNSMNLFEIVHSLKRQFGPEQWTLYKGKHLLCFADNHDVPRLASILTNHKHIPLLYAILFAMPGIPCLYYGSEWGAEGVKGRGRGGDDALRPAFEAPAWNRLTDQLAAMAKAHKESRALCYGDFGDIVLTNRQTVFRRSADGETVLCAVNADDKPYFARFDSYGLTGGKNEAADLLTGKKCRFDGGFELPPCSYYYWKI